MQEGKTPMHIACCRTTDASKYHDRIDVLVMLIQKKPDLDYRDHVRLGRPPFLPPPLLRHPSLSIHLRFRRLFPAPHSHEII